MTKIEMSTLETMKNILDPEMLLCLRLEDKEIALTYDQLVEINDWALKNRDTRYPVFHACIHVEVSEGLLLIVHHRISNRCGGPRRKEIKGV